MHTNHGPRPDPLTDLGYEPRDVNLRRIGMALGFFFGFSVVCMIAGVFIIKAMMPSYFTQNAETAQLAKNIPLPPNPLLQTGVTAKSDIRDLRQREDAALKTPGWVDKPKGVVRLPIDRAIDLAAERLKSSPMATPTGTPAGGGG